MEFIPLDVTLISATDLKDVNLMSKMDVYAVASISGGGAKQKTPVHKDCGPNPKWSHTVRFTIPEAQVKQSHHNLFLNIKLVSDRSFGDKEIGEVNVPLSDLLDSPAAGEKSLTYAVRMKNGKTKGTLNFSCKLGEKFTKAAEPVMAYPPPGATSYGAAPPAPGAYPYPYPAPGGYPPPQQAGYGYQMPPPPQQHQGGYGYPGQYPSHGYPMAGHPPPHKPKRNGNMAMGLGAGLLGGLLIGDMVSDVGSYDAGYDAGFDDGGGFDF